MTIDLYDHELIAIDKGPVAWMAKVQGSAMSLETFRLTAQGKFAEVGFRANVLAYETTEPGTYAFDIEILGRTHEVGEFDFDRQVHEVVNNILEDPHAEKGFINTAAAAAEFRSANPDAHKGHGPGCVA
jgi:hypothetical protein